MSLNASFKQTMEANSVHNFTATLSIRESVTSIVSPGDLS